MNSTATKDYFLTSFVYVLVAFWIVWVVLNTFIIRPFALGGISLDLVAHERAKREARERAAEVAKDKHYTKTHTTRTGEVFTTEYTRHSDGSVESREV